MVCPLHEPKEVEAAPVLQPAADFLDLNGDGTGTECFLGRELRMGS